MNLERKLRAADRRAVALGLSEGVTLVEFVRFPCVRLQGRARSGGGAMEAGRGTWRSSSGRGIPTSRG